MPVCYCRQCCSVAHHTSATVWNCFHSMHSICLHRVSHAYSKPWTQNWCFLSLQSCWCPYCQINCNTSVCCIDALCCCGNYYWIWCHLSIDVSHSRTVHYYILDTCTWLGLFNYVAHLLLGLLSMFCSRGYCYQIILTNNTSYAGALLSAIVSQQQYSLRCGFSKYFLSPSVVWLAQYCTAGSGSGVDESTDHETHSLQGVWLGETSGRDHRLKTNTVHAYNCSVLAIKTVHLS